jgi:SAM-dependent methyltransferase
MTVKFNLETPTDELLDTVSRFSGWYIPEHGRRPQLYVACDQKPAASLEWGSIRPDVSTVYSAYPQAIISGFQGDLLFGAHEAGRSIEVTVRDGASQEQELFRRAYTFGAYRTPAVRERSFNLSDLVVCPDCYAQLGRHDRAWDCPQCSLCAHLRGGVPHFLQARNMPCLHLSEETSTHPYSSEVLELLDQHTSGLVLDFGAGHTPKELLRSNVVYLDAVQYQWTDLVCTRVRLPFRDHTFDAIVSQAVFEHLQDPHHTARELYRILRPGGTIHLDTAFMQPLHGDPWHYFNMTQHGLRQVMAPFEEIRCGMKSYQFPSAGLLMQFEAITPFLSSRKWRKTIEKWRQELQAGAQEFDQALGEFGRTTLAAGFFFEGRRPNTRC